MDRNQVPRAQNSAQQTPKQTPNWGPPPPRVVPPTSAALGSLPPPQQPQPTPPFWPTEERRTPPGPVRQLPLGGAFAVLVTAGLVNVAVQSTANSAAMVLAVVCIVALILAEADRRRLSVFGPAALAITTAVLASIRSSPWVTLPCLTVTMICLVAASQDRLFKRADLLTIVGHYIADLVDSIGWISRSIGRVRPVRTSEQGVWRGLLLAAIVTVPIAALLVSADAVFGQLLLQAGSDDLLAHVGLALLVTPIIAAFVYSAKKASTNTSSLLTRSSAQPLTIVERWSWGR